MFFVITLSLQVLNGSEDLESEYWGLKSNGPISSGKITYTNEVPDNLENFLTEENEDSAVSRLYINAFEKEEEAFSKIDVFKYILSVAAFGAGVPYIASSMQAGEFYLGDDEAGQALGALFSTCTLAFSGGVAAWTSWELCESFKRKSSTNVDLEHLQNEPSCRCKLARNISSILLGILSSIPQVYIAYHYNSAEELAIMSFFYESIIKSYGFNKFLSLFHYSRHDPETQKKLVELRRLSDKAKPAFLELVKDVKKEDLEEFIASFQNLSALELSKMLSMEDSTLPQNNIKSPKDFMMGFPRKSLKYGSLIFPLGGACVNFLLAYQGVDAVFDNLWASGIVSVASVSPSLILDGYATQQVVTHGFDILYNYLRSIKSGIYLHALYPKSYKAAILASFLLASTSTCATAYVVLDTLDNFTESDPLIYFLLFLTATSAVKMGSYGIASTIFNFGEVIAKKVSAVSSYAISCCKKLLNLASLSS